MALTGPAYPRPVPNPPPASADRPLVAADGTIITWDWFRTVLSQYANSPRLTGIAQSFAEAIDQKRNIDAFYSDIWDLDTAEGIGLDIWGRIVGVDRDLPVLETGFFGFSEALPTSQSYNDAGYPATSSPGTPGSFVIFEGFGFKEAGAHTFGEQSFGTYGVITPGQPPVAIPGKGPSNYGGPFYSGSKSFINYQLTDFDFRRLIYAKAASNITDGSIPSLNAILRRLFPGRGNCYVTDVPPPVPYFGFAEAAPTSRTFGDTGGSSGTIIYAGFGFKEASAYAFGQATFGLSTYVGPGEGQEHPTTPDAPFYAGEITPRMVMTFTFEFPLTAVDYAIVVRSNILPKSTGVALSIVQI